MQCCSTSRLRSAAEVDVLFRVIADLAAEGMTMMVVTHEMGFARRVADRVIFMDGGKIVEDCDKEQFFGDVEERAPRTRQFLSKILQH